MSWDGTHGWSLAYHFVRAFHGHVEVTGWMLVARVITGEKILRGGGGGGRVGIWGAGVRGTREQDVALPWTSSGVRTLQAIQQRKQK